MKLTFHQNDQAIAALITPPGEGGVAIVRLSGANSLSIAQHLCSRALDTCQSHRLYRCRFNDCNQNPIDEGLVVVMWPPRSYTGELSVEFHLHGNPLIAQLLLQALVDRGAELALPGEFTYRAYMRGKLDLAQAEGLADLISAKSEVALRAAKNQLTGELSNQIARFKSALTDIASHLEASLDFPDEGLAIAPQEQLLSSLAQVREQMGALAGSFNQGRLARQGWSICLIGRPNVGKSSLLNALVGRDQAIVTSEAGTTRDILEGTVTINNHHARILDTAGLRGGPVGPIEKEGMRRSRGALAAADLALLVLDAATGITSQDLELLPFIDPGKTLVVWNKIDLASAPQLQGALPSGEACETLQGLLLAKSGFVSALCLSGIDQLKTSIAERLSSLAPPSRDALLLTSHRHQLALLKAVDALSRAEENLQRDELAELTAGELRFGLQQLDSILGGDVTEDVLAALFATFCLGK